MEVPSPADAVVAAKTLTLGGIPRNLSFETKLTGPKMEIAFAVIEVLNDMDFVVWFPFLDPQAIEHTR